MSETLKETLEDITRGGDDANATERMRAALCLTILENKIGSHDRDRLHRIINGHSASG